MQANLTLTGDKKLDRTLKEMEPKLAKKGIRKATRAAAKVVLADAKRLVAVDTGRLERSLVVGVAKGPRRKRLPRGTMGHAVATKDGTMFVGDQFYGGFIEFGTSERYARRNRALSRYKDKRRGRVAADPFIRPALYGNERLIRWMFKRTLAKAIKDIAREANRK